MRAKGMSWDGLSHLFYSLLIRKKIAFIWSICNFLLHLFLNPILGELFSAEDGVPAVELPRFIDFVKAQLEGVIGISFSLSHVYKTSDAVIETG